LDEPEPEEESEPEDEVSDDFESDDFESGFDPESRFFSPLLLERRESVA
jgi:hypothetical protein